MQTDRKVPVHTYRTDTINVYVSVWESEGEKRDYTPFHLADMQ